MWPKIIKIMIATSIGITASIFIENQFSPLYSFIIFISTFLLVSRILQTMPKRLKQQLQEKLKITINLKKRLLLLIAPIGVLLLLSYSLLWQYRNIIPTDDTILDKNECLNAFYSELVQFDHRLSNRQYIKARQTFIEKIAPFELMLTEQDKQKIWENQLMLLSVQVQIGALFREVKVDFIGTQISYHYQYDQHVTPFHIDSFIVTFSDNKKGAIMPVNYLQEIVPPLHFKPVGFVVRADVPYFNHSIVITEQDIFTIKRIYELNRLTANVLKENKLRVLSQQ